MPRVDSSHDHRHPLHRAHQGPHRPHRGRRRRRPHRLARDRTRRRAPPRRSRRTPRRCHRPAIAQLVEYFAGARHDFDVPVSLAGTAFQRAVWEQLVSLDFGEIVSYGELGRGHGPATAPDVPSAAPSAPTRSRSSCAATGCSGRTAASPAIAPARASPPRRGCSPTRASPHRGADGRHPPSTLDPARPSARAA